MPARWPHIGLLARLYARIDTTSCQAEINFFALKQVLSDMRAGTLVHKTEKMLLLRLNRHLIPGFASVEQELEALKVKWGAQEAASSVSCCPERPGGYSRESVVGAFFFALVMTLEFSGW